MKLAGPALLALQLSVLAGAQPVADHLKCYKVTDPQAKAAYTADLGGLVAEPGCTIKVPAVMACLPTTKENLHPGPQGTGATGTPNAFGCYKLHCPKAALPTLQLDDQFGSRTVTPRTAKLLCAPAPAPTRTSTTTTTTSSCPPATAFYCGHSACGGGAPVCDPVGRCPQGMTCDATACTCTGEAIPCGDPRLSGSLTCNFCQWGTCPAGMTCGGVPRPGTCVYDCACQ